jgi:phosphopantetheinyl transferase
MEGSAVQARRVMRRALARRLLGAALGIAPASVPIAYGPRGKPELPPPWAFSAASRGDTVAVAFSRDGALGVDLEALEPRLSPELEALVARWMRPSLRRSFGAGALAPFQAWTAIEAIRKASGDGIARGDFTLELLSSAPRVIREATVGAARYWRLHEFPVAGARASPRSLAGCLAWPCSGDPSSREVRLHRLTSEQTAACLCGAQGAAKAARQG